jgi:hypothetical protein
MSERDLPQNHPSASDYKNGGAWKPDNVTLRDLPITHPRAIDNPNRDASADDPWKDFCTSAAPQPAAEKQPAETEADKQ